MKSIKRRGEAGFSLLELMVVIAIIAILISVSGYAWQVMVRRGNEAAAVSYLNKINVAQVYFASKHRGRFAKTLIELVDSELLDKKFGKPDAVVDGYRFTLRTAESPSDSFSINADPVIGSGIRATGTSHYFLDSSSHSMTSTEEDRPATAADPSI